VPACRPGKSLPSPNGVANGAPNVHGAAPAAPPRCWTPAVVETRAGPGRPVAATGTKQSFARQSFQPAPRMAAGTQAGSSVRDHAWEASSGKTAHNDHQHASHCSLKSSPKTRTLILKRSTKHRRPLYDVSSMALKGAVRRRQVFKTQCLAER